ncbi:glucokinase [Austwickia chelonae]|uniref:Putative glucokinase n=1 Tax=Austwickia chelonae NBRC 105200 TaxID=1184607 RepID=K6UN69_9MICO|nr:ROK family protein [Austwickia chelonae]GAB78731.1 putative glucokinase [Austwickia chelonae NBRC 105200]SEW35118.1 glucokinase [Austwickia chelonae]
MNHPPQPTAELTLAVDIGGTKITAALVDPAGRTLDRRGAPTPAEHGATAVLDTALDLGRELTAGRQITAIGIGSAGVIDPHTGTVTHATDALPGWPGTPLAAAFTDTFGVPAHALNDVHAHALGEARHGAGRGHRSMLLVAVGTGIGGAHVLNGTVLFGEHFVAGHIGHLAAPEAQGIRCSCGRDGHLEGLASGPGILTAFRRAGGQAADTRAVAALAARARTRPDDPAADLAARTLHLCGRATGRIIGGLANILDPAVIVLTGGVADIGEHWWRSVRDGMSAETMDAVAATPLLPATAGQDAALLGAAAFARGRLHPTG